MTEKLIFRTLNSAYSIDHDTGWWQRLQNNGDVDPDDPLRTEEGELWAHGQVVVGQGVVMICPPLPTSTEGAVARRIRTSAVVEVLSGSTDAWQIPEGVPL